MAMKETMTRVKTYITSLMTRLRSRSGSLIWRVTSYWPFIAAAVVGLPLVFMPAMFDLASWTYVLTLPIGAVGAVLAYLAAYMAME